MAHHVLRGSTVLVLFSGRGPDRFSSVEADGDAVTGDEPTDTVGGLQQLAVGMGVPVGAGPAVNRTRREMPSPLKTGFM
jgi:hypothetical protein